jgi:hypothetical protein
MAFSTRAKSGRRPRSRRHFLAGQRGDQCRWRIFHVEPAAARVHSYERRQAVVAGLAHAGQVPEFVNRLEGAIARRPGDAGGEVIVILDAVKTPQVVLVAPVENGVHEVAPCRLADTAGLQCGIEEFRLRGIEVDETGGVADSNRYIVFANPNVEQAAVDGQLPVGIRGQHFEDHVVNAGFG